ncbi:hypothetical protein [Helicobacter pylori]|uniref:hypothetical protein n=1 Tax=Helicobacter pylori TaxID=210 RepID=UPI0018D1DC7C|nr:hypothetical protein [Helicobacter pylori]MBH0293952.1 hypothetical protein [Helicobacter pylori]MBH0299867.1 hypothetical protein [Helicobacter pylori]
MKLFNKWNDIVEAHDSFSGECHILAKEVSFFLEYLLTIDESFKNAILKMFKNNSDRFSILVKEAESAWDYPLVFKFTSENDKEDAWEFIVKDKQSENQTMREFLKSIQDQDKDHSLIKQIERAGECISFMKQQGEKAEVSNDAMAIIEYLIVELLKDGGFK